MSIGDRVTEVALSLSTRVGIVGRPLLIPSFISSGTFDRYVWSQSARFIADPGTEVKMFAQKNGTSGGIFCQASLAGYLVDKP